MGDNKVREGDRHAKSMKWPPERIQRLQNLGIELPASMPDIIDELLDRGEDLQELRRIINKEK